MLILIQIRDKMDSGEDLNTSYVNVNLLEAGLKGAATSNLNTSYVNVNRRV